MTTSTAGVPDPGALAEFYSTSAAEYQRLWAPELVALSRQLLVEMSWDGVNRVLEVATGVGTVLPEIRKTAPGAFVVGIDIAEGMLRLAPRGFPVSVMDAMRLGIQPGVFDAVLIPFALFHLPDPVAGLAEAARVTVSGGVVATVTWGYDHDFPAWDIWEQELDTLGASSPGSGLARHDLVDTPDKVRTLLEGAGFEHVRTWKGLYDRVMTTDEFLEHRVGHGASRRRFDSLAPDAGTRCLDSVRARLERLDSIRDTTEVIFAVARRP